MFQGIQSALDPQGPNAAAIAEIAWVLIIGAAVIFAAVMVLAAYAVFAPRQRAARLSSRALIVGGGIVFPAVVLTALLAYSLARASALGKEEPAALVIHVTGEQWWWRVHYLDAAGRRDFATANEIHIPAGRPVELRLASADVIHAFWVPALAGKLDMVPGKEHRLRLSAERPGVFRGQCAEYCGGPHGMMSFFVVAHTPAEFERWREAQRRVPPPPADAAAAKGASLFATLCAACHTVRGTAAEGVRGPDLTHVGSRRTIGAALLPMGRGALSGWISSSQHLKPGNLMPSFASLPGEELGALVAYLEGLR